MLPPYHPAPPPMRGSTASPPFFPVVVVMGTVALLRPCWMRGRRSARGCCRMRGCVHALLCVRPCVRACVRACRGWLGWLVGWLVWLFVGWLVGLVFGSLKSKIPPHTHIPYPILPHLTSPTHTTNHTTHSASNASSAAASRPPAPKTLPPPASSSPGPHNAVLPPSSAPPPCRSGNGAPRLYSHLSGSPSLPNASPPRSRNRGRSSSRGNKRDPLHPLLQW
jgi:hypothetical protein